MRALAGFCAVPILLLVILLASGCREERVEPVTTQQHGPPTHLSPEDLGALTAQIRKQPTRAQEVLAKRGLTKEQFQEGMRTVAENREYARRYTAAYERAN